MDKESADYFGIAAGYYDVFAKWHAAHPDTVRKLIEEFSTNRSERKSDFAEVSDGAPKTAFQKDDRKQWGIAVQLYSLRSRRNWGIGDFGDLKTLIVLAAKCGAGAIGLNPLHALFLDDPDRISPYAPSSRLFLNALYIDVNAIPEFPGIDKLGWHERIERLQTCAFVDYRGVTELKEEAFHLAYTSFVRNADTTRQQAFASFCQRQGEKLRRFVCFEALRRKFRRRSWKDWPSPWHNPNLTCLDSFYESHQQECQYFAFLQWIAHEQLAICQLRAVKEGMSIGLFLDLAVGVDPQGADAWAAQTQILQNFSIGAPPDEFNPAGQNWGLAPFNPHNLSDHNFAAFRELLASAMTNAGAVRLDHVLGLMRLFLIPSGSEPTRGVYVRYPLQSLLATIAEESNRYQCMFIGEDLGTVPDGFREMIGRYGIWSYRVMMFERNSDGSFKMPQTYPVGALATFATHDLATFNGWLSGRDLETKRSINIDPGEDRLSRTASKQALHAVLSVYGNAEHFVSVAAFLAATPSRLIIVSAEDVLGVLDQVNVPGTTDQYPNWRHRLPIELEEWDTLPSWREVISVLSRARRIK